jgi:hypothetical protein
MPDVLPTDDKLDIVVETFRGKGLRLGFFIRDEHSRRILHAGFARNLDDCGEQVDAWALKHGYTWVSGDYIGEVSIEEVSLN